MTTLFTLALAAVAFAYFGYPCTLLFLSLLCRRVVHKAPFFPRLTFLITACNEEKRIRTKLENTLEFDYPRDLLQILVASDGSTDATNAIVGEFASRGVRWINRRHAAVAQIRHSQSRSCAPEAAGQTANQAIE